jgi:hypothetical protein
MTEEEFERLTAAYGGDLERWPKHLRCGAAELARRAPRPGKLLQAEYAFDERLRAAVPEVPLERVDTAMAAVAGAIARQRRAATCRRQLCLAPTLRTAIRRMLSPFWRAVAAT